MAVTLLNTLFASLLLTSQLGTSAPIPEVVPHGKRAYSSIALHGHVFHRRDNPKEVQYISIANTTLYHSKIETASCYDVPNPPAGGSKYDADSAKKIVRDICHDIAGPVAVTNGTGAAGNPTVVFTGEEGYYPTNSWQESTQNGRDGYLVSKDGFDYFMSETSNYYDRYRCAEAFAAILMGCSNKETNKAGSITTDDSHYYVVQW